MPKRVPPLNAMQVERIRRGEELIDGDVPGLRVTGTAAGPSWGLSVRVKGRRPTIQVGVGIGLAEARRRAKRLRRRSPTAVIQPKRGRRQSSARRTP